MLPIMIKKDNEYVLVDALTLLDAEQVIQYAEYLLFCRTHPREKGRRLGLLGTAYGDARGTPKWKVSHISTMVVGGQIELSHGMGMSFIYLDDNDDVSGIFTVTKLDNPNTTTL